MKLSIDVNSEHEEYFRTYPYKRRAGMNERTELREQLRVKLGKLEKIDMTVQTNVINSRYQDNGLVLGR